MPEQTALERAFELARTGRFTRVEEIIKQLRQERHRSDQVTGPVLRRQLRDLIADSVPPMQDP
jgi:hypothetical protein